MFLNILNIPFLSQMKLFMADILETEAVFQFVECATLLQKNIIRHSIPNVINNTDRNIIEKLHTHSFDSFVKHAKKMFIAKYNELCIIPNFYVCGRA